VKGKEYGGKWKEHESELRNDGKVGRMNIDDCSHQILERK
jgi:hypothetical protein